MYHASWVSSIQTVVLTADVFQLLIKYGFCELNLRYDYLYEVLSFTKKNRSPVFFNVLSLQGKAPVRPQRPGAVFQQFLRRQASSRREACAQRQPSAARAVPACGSAPAAAVAQR